MGDQVIQDSQKSLAEQHTTTSILTDHSQEAKTLMCFCVYSAAVIVSGRMATVGTRNLNEEAIAASVGNEIRGGTPDV